MDDNVTDMWGTQRLYPDSPPPAPAKQSKPAPPPPVTTAPGTVPARRTRPGRGQDITSTVVELVGITVFVTGFYLIAPYLGLIVAGLCLILLGAALAR